MTNERVTLRPVERDDMTFLRDLANDPVVRRQVVGWDWPFSLAAQERWFDGGIDTSSTRRFVIEDESGSAVGLTGLWNIDWHNRTAMSAIKIGGRQNVRRRGFGLDALRSTMRFAFRDVGLHRLYAEVLSFNQASLALYRDRCGWTEEGVSREHIWKDGQHWDLVHLGILRHEYDQWSAGAGGET